MLKDNTMITCPKEKHNFSSKSSLKLKEENLELKKKLKISEQENIKLLQDKKRLFQENLQLLEQIRNLKSESKNRERLRKAQPLKY